MALINCPGCRNSVSDAAVACPRCGHPIREVPAPQPPAAAPPAPLGELPPPHAEQTPAAPVPAPSPAPAPAAPTYAPPAYAAPAAQVPRHVDSNMVSAIFATLFCCLPLGIVSIIYAAQVSGKLARGDYAGAAAAASTSRTFSWLAAGLSLAFGCFWFAIFR